MWNPPVEGSVAYREGLRYRESRRQLAGFR